MDWFVSYDLRFLFFWLCLYHIFQSVLSHSSWICHSMNSNGTYRTGTLRVVYTQNIVLWFAKGVWCTQFQSSFLNVYFRLSGFQSSLLPICYRDGPNGCLHCTKVHHESYPTSFSLISLMLSSQNIHMELWHVAILSPIRTHTGINSTSSVTRGEQNANRNSNRNF